MKKLFILMSLISLTSFGQTQKITVNVPNVPNNEGKVVFALYDSETFMVAAPVRASQGTIDNGKTQVEFDSIAPGQYAIICYHDANDNDKMDFQPNGMPLEAYGATNNDMTLGPPSWEASKFSLKEEPLSLQIRF